MKLRVLLPALVGMLTAVVVAAAALGFAEAWHMHTLVIRFIEADGARAKLIATAISGANERGAGYLALMAPGIADAAARAYVMQEGMVADRAAIDARTALDRLQLDDSVRSSTVLFDGLHVRIKEMRPRVLTALGQPIEQRAPNLAAEWFQLQVDAIEAGFELRRSLVYDVGERPANGALLIQVALRNFAWFATEYLARERTLLGAAVASGKPPSPALSGELARLHGHFELAWKTVLAIPEAALPPDVLAALQRARVRLQADLADTEHGLFRALALEASAPVDVARWWDTATRSIDALEAVQAASLAWSISYAETLERRTENYRYAAAGLVMLGIAAMLAALRLVISRVTRPVDALTGAMARLAEGDLSVELVAPRRNDEIGAMFAAFQILKVNAAERARLEAEKLAAARQAAIAIKDSETRLRAVLDSAVDAILVIGETGLIESFNVAAERLFGYRADEIVGRSISLLTPLARDGDVDAVTRALAHRVGKTDEVERRHANGTLIAVERTVGAIQLGDRRLYVAVMRDITERRKIDRLKSEFISTVSHELRTPLTAIRASLGLIASGTVGRLPPEAKMLSEIAVASSDRLVRLVNDLLDIERIESGTIEFDLQPVELGALIERAIEHARGAAQEAGVSIDYARPPPAGTIVEADPERLMQVFDNLISNAVKFSRSGDVVTITTELRDDRVNVAVADQGDGIPERFRARIFDKFAQADSSDTRSRGGTGLGLAITRGIIQRLDGTVGFESGIDGGTVFHFELPARLAAGDPVSIAGEAGPLC